VGILGGKGGQDLATAFFTEGGGVGGGVRGAYTSNSHNVGVGRVVCFAVVGGRDLPLFFEGEFLGGRGVSGGGDSGGGHLPVQGVSIVGHCKKKEKNRLLLLSHHLGPKKKKKDWAEQGEIQLGPYV